MKIGIVTVHDLNNFGAFLQAYGLKNVLENMGHEVFHIRSYSKKYARGMFYRIRPYGNEYFHLPSFIALNFKGFRKHLVFLKAQKCFRVLDQYDEDLDMIILGSDEIWNVTNPLFREPAFYGAGMKRVMAYAPSIGNATVEELKCIPKEYFQRINPILARDKNTVSFLKTMDIDAPTVCDPTLLADRSIFMRPYRHKLMDGVPYLLLYLYGYELNKAEIKAVRDFAAQRGLRILSVCFDIPWCDGTINCSPLDFCAVIQKAEYVVTATFHGTIFSILNHKHFVSLPQSPKTCALLESLGLQQHILHHEEWTTENLTHILSEQNIDYKSVDAIIGRMQTNSRELLNSGVNLYQKESTGGINGNKVY